MWNMLVFNSIIHTSSTSAACFDKLREFLFNFSRAWRDLVVMQLDKAVWEIRLIEEHFNSTLWHSTRITNYDYQTNHRIIVYTRSSKCVLRHRVTGIHSGYKNHDTIRFIKVKHALAILLHSIWVQGSNWLEINAQKFTFLVPYQ